jgi:ABC-type transport system involved in multi-copper enzyme maturation permease subunit
MNLIRRLNNPILGKELRLRMRSKRTPWAISLYLLILGGIALTFIFLITGNDAYFNPHRSREIFMTLSILQFAMISFVTPGLTAGVISGERERQTLNLLLTTNSTPTKIIIGKWLSSLSFMVFLVLASIPLYSIVFLFGGISPTQLVQVFAFYLVSMLALGSFGVMFSTIFKRTGVATVVTYGVIFAYTAATFIGAEFLREFFRRSSNSGTNIIAQQKVALWVDFLYSINPFASILQIFHEGPIGRHYYGSGPVNQGQLIIDPYWIYFIFFSSITLIALGVAIYIINPVRRGLFKR